MPAPLPNPPKLAISPENKRAARQVYIQHLEEAKKARAAAFQLRSGNPELAAAAAQTINEQRKNSAPLGAKLSAARRGLPPPPTRAEFAAAKKANFIAAVKAAVNSS